MDEFEKKYTVEDINKTLDDPDSSAYRYRRELMNAMQKEIVAETNDNNGEISLTVQFGTGTPPYSYNWTGPSSFTSNIDSTYDTYLFKFINLHFSNASEAFFLKFPNLTSLSY